jgi:uncharacterized membrane protein YgcG
MEAAMLPFPLTTRALFLVGPPSKVWSQVQKIYTKRDEDSAPLTNVRRSLYRNVLLSLFNRIGAERESRPVLLRGLLQHVRETESFDGLESIFLTLANAAELEGQHEVFESGINLWCQFGRAPWVAGAGPLVFFDVADGAITFFSAEVAASLRPGAAYASVIEGKHHLGRRLAELGLFRIEQSFDPASGGRVVMGPRAKSVSEARRHRTRVAAARAVHDARVVGSVLGSLRGASEVGPPTLTRPGELTFMMAAVIQLTPHENRTMRDTLSLQLLRDTVPIDDSWTILNSDGSVTKGSVQEIPFPDGSRQLIVSGETDAEGPTSSGLVPGPYTSSGETIVAGISSDGKSTVVSHEKWINTVNEDATAVSGTWESSLTSDDGSASSERGAWTQDSSGLSSTSSQVSADGSVTITTRTVDNNGDGNEHISRVSPKGEITDEDIPIHESPGDESGSDPGGAVGGGGDGGGGDGGGGDGGGGDGGGGESGGCFTADTWVLMGDGEARAIDSIAVGDHVLARSESGGPVASRRVKHVFRHHVAETLRLHLADGSCVDTTGPHRFFVVGRGFLPASELTPGATLATSADGGAIAVQRLEPRPGEAVVYNLSVADDPTYFVGPHGLFVHNVKPEKRGPEEPDDGGRSW